MSSDTIVVIEDSPDEVYFLKRAYEKAGLKNPLVFAHDGQAGLRLLTVMAERSRIEGESALPLFVLLDLKLPVLNGFQVLEGIKKIPELFKLVVIVLTSSDIEADILLAYELGARSYLIKPPQPADLLAIVNTVHMHASRGWLDSPDLCWVRKRPSGR